MSPRLAELCRRPWRGIAALAFIAVVPKCVACLAAYVGLGAMLGLGGPELCGAPTESSHVSVLIVSALLLSVGLAGATMCKDSIPSRLRSLRWFPKLDRSPTPAPATWRHNGPTPPRIER